MKGTKMPRTKCPVCLREVAELKGDGGLRMHAVEPGRNKPMCRGSYCDPKSEARCSHCGKPGASLWDNGGPLPLHFWCLSRDSVEAKHEPKTPKSPTKEQELALFKLGRAYGALWATMEMVRKERQ